MGAAVPVHRFSDPKDSPQDQAALLDQTAGTSASVATIASANCTACDAVCCRLTVVLMPEDHIAEHLTSRTESGLHVMARDEDGWCVALDNARMCCSIYDARPRICRKFAMAGPYCIDVRTDYADRRARGIPLTLY